MPYRDAEKSRIYQRTYKRLRRGGDCCTTPVHPALSTEFRLQTAVDALNLIAEQIGLVREETEAGTLEKARTVGYLVGISLKAIETRDVVARMEQIESVLKLRKKEDDHE